MPGGLGPRFVVEAGFLILLAVGTGLADLTPRTIVIVMAAAWALVALLEWLAWRDRPTWVEPPAPWRERAREPEALTSVVPVAPPTRRRLALRRRPAREDGA